VIIDHRYIAKLTFGYNATCQTKIIWTQN